MCDEDKGIASKQKEKMARLSRKAGPQTKAKNTYLYNNKYYHYLYNNKCYHRVWVV